MNLNNPGERRQKLVSFSGIDGAGKSTQIARLRQRLSDSGLRAVVVVFWEEVATLTRLREVTGHALFKGDKGVGSPDRPLHRRDKNVTTWYMTLVRLGFYLLDALSLNLVVHRSLRTGADVIIFDRYLFDEVANLPLNHWAARAYVRLLMKLVPQPDAAFVLDADPIQARRRKPEYPIEFLHLNRASYRTLSQLIGGLTFIDPLSEPETAQRVMLAVGG